MSEQDTPRPAQKPERRLSRRKFISALAGLGGLATLKALTPSENPAPANPTVTPNKGESTPTPVPTAAKPETKAPPKNIEVRRDLPKDIVPSEELAEKYHVKVWNQPDLKLHIRRSALVKEPYFTENHYEQSSLAIVLFDGLISADNMTEEQKKGLPELAKNLNEVAENYRNQQMREFNDPEKRKEMATKYNEDKAYFLALHGENSEELKKLENRYYPYLNSPRPSDFKPFFYPASGVFTGSGPTTSTFNGVVTKVEPGKYYILLATPSSKSRSENSSQFLQKQQSFVSPDYFTVNPRNKDYPVEPADPRESSPLGFNLRHELAHAAKKPHPYTDLSVLENLRQAHENYLKGDDSGYSYVFETPQGNIYALNGSPEDGVKTM